MTEAQAGSAAKVHVELAEHSYNVVIGAGVIDLAGPTVRARCGDRATRGFIVADHNLPETLVARAARSLEAAGLRTASMTVRASEPDKSLRTLETVLDQVAQTRHERWDPIVALGGGIVGDVAGFAAAVYRRGVPVLQCPTTLLAMVDASVGGKTGTNLAVGPAGSLKKNMVGAFHQPVGVLADLESLDSLPAREFRAGLAECVKHGLISAEFGDAGLFDWIAENAPRLAARDAALVRELVERNVRVKARVVAGDEREEADDAAGGRALLNLGHTFGHAIEPMLALSPGRGIPAPLLHGEAVALGLMAACAAAEAMGLASPGTGARVGGLLQQLGLPTKVAGLPAHDVLLAAMSHDKKAMGGRLRLVLPDGRGHARVVADPPVQAVRAGLAAIAE